MTLTDHAQTDLQAAAWRARIFETSNFFRLIGPPGTGKTTQIKEIIRTGQTEYGWGPDAFTIVTFSRTAAFRMKMELARNDLHISEGHIGTLHSLAFAALGKPPLIYDKAHTEAWNERYPQWRMTARKLDEELHATAPGDRMLDRSSHLRGAQHPTETWPADVITFEERWHAFKQERAAYDFTDLISEAFGTEPLGKGLLIADEAQDFSALEQCLVHVWGGSAQSYLVAGDPNQAIYADLKGATPEQFLIPGEIPAQNELILNHSYRNSAAVADAAMSVLRQLDDSRFHHQYTTERPGGRVYHLNPSYDAPAGLVPLAAEATARKSSLMVLAHAKYMLEPVIAELMRAGIPFHNPYRTTSVTWNPLPAPRSNAINVHERVAALIKADWTWTDVSAFSELLPAKDYFHRGMKKAAREEAEVQGQDFPDAAALRRIFTDTALQALRDAPVETLRLAATSAGTMTPRLAFALKVVERYGYFPPAQVILGTPHSVKGGEADVVVLVPDYPANARNMQELLRVSYVAITRARHSVMFLKPANTGHALDVQQITASQASAA